MRERQQEHAGDKTLAAETHDTREEVPPALPLIVPRARGVPKPVDGGHGDEVVAVPAPPPRLRIALDEVLVLGFAAIPLGCKRRELIVRGLELGS